ncbi:MAG: hypothetical protein PHR70_03460 [Tissierellia bacterium]|nr:hypothetical protein [Tissierellia bacterium]
MKIKPNIRKTFIALSLLIVVSFTIPAYAADGNHETDNNTTVINYDDIEDLVLENNLRLKSNKYSLDDMEDALDDLEEARDEIREMQREIYSLSGSITAPEGPEGSIANATKASLNVAGGSLGMSLPSTRDVREQIQLAELNFAYSEKQLVSASKELFLLYHQINDSLIQIERNSQLLESKIGKAKISYEYGYVLSSTLDDLESSLKELNNKYDTILHQKDLLLLNFKNLIGVKSSEDIELGNIPELSREFISQIDFESDIKEAIKNSMSIGIRKKELKNADASGKRINNEVKIRKNEIEVELKNQYQLLIQQDNILLLAENNLNILENKLTKGHVQFNVGNITKSNLDSLINEVENQKSKIEIDESNLFKEIEKYKAMVAGMI